MQIYKDKTKNYMTRMSDGTILANSRFKFSTKQEAVDLFPKLKDVRIYGK